MPPSKKVSVPDGAVTESGFTPPPACWSFAGTLRGWAHTTREFVEQLRHKKVR